MGFDAWLDAVAAMVWKDFMLDARRKVEASSVVVFSAASGVLVAYILGGVAGVSPAAVAVAASLVMVFLAVFGSLSSFVREADRGTLEGLRVSPVGPEAIYLAKLVYSYALIASATLVYLAVTAVFANLWELLSPASLAASLSAGLYLAAVSSLTSAILVFSEARGILMPVMVLVLSLPYIQLAAPVLTQVYSGAGSAFSAAVLGLASAAFIAVALWLSRFILEAA